MTFYSKAQNRKKKNIALTILPFVKKKKKKILDYRVTVIIVKIENLYKLLTSSIILYTDTVEVIKRIIVVVANRNNMQQTSIEYEHDN